MKPSDQNGCTLDAVELSERVAAWRKVASRAKTRELRPDRIISTYPSESSLLEELNQLIAAEARCCAFLSFTVSEGPSETIVDMRYPPEARELVEQIVPTPDRS